MIEHTDRLLAELALMGRHVHWPLGELLDLEHATRRRLMAEVLAQQVDDDDR